MKNLLRTLALLSIVGTLTCKSQTPEKMQSSVTGVPDTAVCAKEVLINKSNNKVYRYNDLPVHFRGGIKLMLDNSTPLHAAKINIYADDVEWHCGYPSEIIRTPRGRGIPSGNGYNYPGLFELGIVLFQSFNPVQYTQIKANNEDEAQEILLNSDANIIVNVNDGTARPSYSDNKGSFDIIIEVVKSK